MSSAVCASSDSEHESDGESCDDDQCFHGSVGLSSASSMSAWAFSSSVIGRSIASPVTQLTSVVYLMSCVPVSVHAYSYFCEI